MSTLTFNSISHKNSEELKTSIQVTYLLIAKKYSSNRVRRFCFVVLLKMEQVHGHFQFYCLLLLHCYCYHLNWVTDFYCGYFHCHYHYRWSDLDWDLDPDMLLKNERSKSTVVLYCSKVNDKTTSVAGLLEGKFKGKVYCSFGGSRKPKF